MLNNSQVHHHAPSFYKHIWLEQTIWLQSRQIYVHIIFSRVESDHQWRTMVSKQCTPSSSGANLGSGVFFLPSSCCLGPSSSFVTTAADVEEALIFSSANFGSSSFLMKFMLSFWIVSRALSLVTIGSMLLTLITWVGKRAKVFEEPENWIWIDTGAMEKFGLSNTE